MRALGLSLLVACASTASDSITDSAPLTALTDTAVPPTHDQDIQPIWNLHCGAGCHTGGADDGSLNLDDAYDKIVGVASVDVPSMPLIDPGDPENSYLWRKIDGTHIAAGGAGATMPRTGSIGKKKRDTIEAWILDNAPR